MGALLLILMFGGLVIAGGVLSFAMLGRNWKLVRRIATTCIVGLVIYFGVLFGVSVASYQKNVKLNEEFCIEDLCFSSARAEIAKTIGTGASQSTAQGMYYIVQVKIRSDAKRVTQAIRPDSVGIIAIDDQGRRYAYSAGGQKSLDETNRSAPLELPWFRSLGPGESSERQIVFDLPADAKSPSIEITEGQWPSYLVIGDENSFFHKKTRIRLSHIESR